MNRNMMILAWFVATAACTGAQQFTRGGYPSDVGGVFYPPSPEAMLAQPGVPVSVYQNARVAVYSDTKTCPGFGFNGIRTTRLSEIQPAASHIVVFNNATGMFMQAKGCLGNLLTARPALTDLNGNGHLQGYYAAPVGLSLYVPIDQVGGTITVFGLRCDPNMVCQQMWQRRYYKDRAEQTPATPSNGYF